MMFPKKMKLVIAGSHNEFVGWCVAKKLSPHDPFVKYIHSRNQLRGFRADQIDIIMTGQYWKSPVLDSHLLDQFIDEGAGFYKEVI